MEEFFFGLSEPAALGVPLLSVGLQGGPGLGVVAAAVGRRFPLTIPQEHVGSPREEESEEAETDPVHMKSEPFFFFKGIHD